MGDALLSIERQEWQVQQDGNPVSVDDEQEGQEGVNGGLGDDVGVQAVAKIDGVDVVTVENIPRQHIVLHPYMSWPILKSRQGPTVGARGKRPVIECDPRLRTTGEAKLQ